MQCSFPSPFSLSCDSLNSTARASIITVLLLQLRPASGLMSIISEPPDMKEICPSNKYYLQYNTCNLGAHLLS